MPRRYCAGISDPARRRIPNPVLRVGRSSIPSLYQDIRFPEPTGSEPWQQQLRGHVTHCRHCLPFKSAPKKADQRSSIEAETPRSPSPEPYAEITLNSTAYAALAVEAGERRALSPLPTLSHQTYAAMAASPPCPKSQLQDNERISPGPPTAVTGTTSSGKPAQLDAAARKNHITWFCYAPVTEANKDRYPGTAGGHRSDAIITALQELGFPAEYARPIPPAKEDRGACSTLDSGTPSKMDSATVWVNTLLNMPEVTIEGWRGRAGPLNAIAARCSGIYRQLPPAASMRTAVKVTARLQGGTKTRAQTPRPSPGKRQEMSGV
ncbi:hypothetical protein EVAR_50315_1 [Eumeta japonica]|uniref:Uncharacterized protein n=1 Tax=Eumeta variegata TaxID=151549 RepID=A0A4C2A2I1_EUMVA|nr:hypothetical protein EVAR_50315_1 [Eumeta japonica]